MLAEIGNIYTRIMNTIDDILADLEIGFAAAL